MLAELSDCGFSPHEQRVLSFLLQHGTSPARTVATATKLKRPTVYLTLQNLLDAGFVSKKKVGNVTVFESVPRSALPEIIRARARARLTTLEGAADRLRDSLRSLTPAPAMNLGGFSVESLESERGLYREMYESLLAGDYLGIFNPQYAITSQTKPILLNFFERTAATRPHIREIAIEGPMCDWYRQRIKNPHHHVRVLPVRATYITDLILVNGTLLLLDYSLDSMAAIKITHRNLYVSFTALFEELWVQCRS